MNFSQILDIAGACAILLGAAQSLSGAIGLVRFHTLFLRLHATTKPQTLGLLLILLGLALSLRSWSAFGTLIIVGTCQALTTPVAAHMVSRAAYRTGLVTSASLEVDELDVALNRDGDKPS